MSHLAAILLAWLSGTKVVHVFVPLCDNENQGIVRVPATLGNGRDPGNNLYWGARYGLKAYFKRTGRWRILECSTRPDSGAVLERAVFLGPSKMVVIADAYDGARMRDALVDFFASAAGATTTVQTSEGEFRTGDLSCFVGHNGLMDLRLEKWPNPKAGRRRAMVLSCKSDSHFSAPLRRLGCEPLLMTSGFMAPEAYTLDAVLRAWADGGNGERLRQAAASAYAQYQKCSLAAAQRIFVVPP